MDWIEYIVIVLITIGIMHNVNNLERPPFIQIGYIYGPRVVPQSP